jgi:hypothetical protein
VERLRAECFVLLTHCEMKPYRVSAVQRAARLVLGDPISRSVADCPASVAVALSVLGASQAVEAAAVARCGYAKKSETGAGKGASTSLDFIDELLGRQRDTARAMRTRRAKQFNDTVLHERAEGWRGVHARGRRYSTLTRPDGSKREEAEGGSGAGESNLKTEADFWSWAANKNTGPTKGTDRLGRKIRVRTVYRDEWEDPGVKASVPPKENLRLPRRNSKSLAEQRASEQQRATERAALAQLSTVQAAAAAAAEYEARQRIAARKKQTRMHMWEKAAYRRQAKAFGNFYDGIHVS